MTIPVRQKFDSADPRLEIQLTDDGSRTLIRKKSGNAYHSGSGAAAETRHVYLQNSGVLDRLQNGQACRVLEIGLGTGLGLLMTMDVAVRCCTPLVYVAVEKDWIGGNVLRQIALDTSVSDKSLVDRFLQFRESQLEHPKGLVTWELSSKHQVHIYCGDLLDWQSGAADEFDAVYFDPFAPESNPELWTVQVAESMHRLIKPGGRLVTYCVSRSVREMFAVAGFQVSRVKGPKDGKREVLIATV